MLRRTRSSEHHLHHNSWLYDLLIRGHQDWKDKKEANRWQQQFIIATLKWSKQGEYVTKQLLIRQAGKYPQKSHVNIAHEANFCDISIITPTAEWDHHSISWSWQRKTFIQRTRSRRRAWPTSLHGQQTPRSQTLSRSTWHEKCKCNRHESLWMIKLSPLRSKFQPPNVIYIHEDMLMRHILTFAAAGLWVRNSWEPGWFSPRAAQTTTDVMSKWTACKKNR